MKKITKVSFLIKSLPWLVVACMTVLMIPAQAQQNATLALTSSNAGTNRPINDENLHGWLANNTKIEYPGRAAFNVTLNVVVYEDDRQVKTYSSPARPLGTPVAELLPREDFFALDPGRRGFFGWLSDWIFGPISGSGSTAPAGPYAGASSSFCDGLSNYASREACRAANGYPPGRAAGETVNGPIVVIYPLPDGNASREPVAIDGLTFVLAED